MRAEVIQSMLADPQLDPTSWVGKALITWIKRNTKTCLSDPVARPYLFRGMEIGDIDKLTDGVQELYSETRDHGLIEKYVYALNDLSSKTPKYDYTLKYALERFARMFSGKTCNEHIVGHLVELHIEGDSNNYNDYGFLSYIKAEHIDAILRNRHPKWGENNWYSIIDKIPKEELLTKFTTSMWPNHISSQSADAEKPERIQNILWRVFLRLPKHALPNWLDFLKSTCAQSTWWGASDSISKKVDKSEIKFDDKVCRCGVVSANKSGASLHKRKCDNKDINLLQAAKIMVADSLTCNHCGKACKSAPGITLHKKKCKSKMGNTIREERENLF
jgi:hypothetical protein